MSKNPKGKKELEEVPNIGYPKPKKLEKEKKGCKVYNCFIKAIDDRGYCKGHKQEVLYPRKKTNNFFSRYSKPKPKVKGQRKKRSKIPTYSSAETSTWNLFSEVIRLRDTDRNGYGTCINTGKQIHFHMWKEKGKWKKKGNCDAGHRYTRSYKNIIFDFDNVHAESASQNRFKGEDKVGYDENLLIKIGQTRCLELKQRAISWKRSDQHRPSIEWMRDFRKLLRKMRDYLLEQKTYTV